MMRSIRTIIFTIVTLLLATTISAETRPNVVLVMTDDQGYGDLGCHGNPDIVTPNLDELFKQSIRLTNYHVDPTCSPTRSALLTGRYSWRTGVWHTIMGRSLLRRDEITLGNAFADASYRTGSFGKWHLGDNYPFRAQDRGFHDTVMHGGGGVTQTPDYWGNDYFDDTYWRNGVPEKFKGYCTDVFFNEGMKFIERNRDRPFFCYIPTNAPHGPYFVAQKYKKIYEDKGIKGRLAAFWGMITNIDENMGRLMKKLDELKLAENTILIFTTDNGTSAGRFNSGMRGRKGSEYDGGHRVPFFIRWPGKLEAGRDINQLTAHVDVLQTLADLCDVKLPENLKLDGRSLKPLFMGEAKDWPDRTMFVQSHRVEVPRPWRKSAVMTQKWRLVNGGQLYDMQADPGQKKNIAAAHPQIVAKLKKSYEEMYASVSGRFDEFCEIVIGSERENPSRITAHDWHGRSVPWNQRAIRNPKVFSNGFWAVEVEQSGKYEFTLRQQDEVAKFAIQANLARLKIGGVDLKKPIDKGSPEVTFQVELKAGRTKLETWFTNAAGKSRGAYFVYVKYLGEG